MMDCNKHLFIVRARTVWMKIAWSLTALQDGKYTQLVEWSRNVCEMLLHKLSNTCEEDHNFTKNVISKTIILVILILIIHILLILIFMLMASILSLIIIAIVFITITTITIITISLIGSIIGIIIIYICDNVDLGVIDKIIRYNISIM